MVTSSRVSPARPSPAPSHGLFVKPQISKAKKRANVDRIENSIQELKTIKDQVLSNKESEDEFSYFGKNIASQLRQLPIMDALDLESEILELVKRKRKSFIDRESALANTNDTSYTVEIPEHVLQQVWTLDGTSNNIQTNDTAKEESQSILLPRDQALQPSERYNALTQAVRSIGGFGSECR